MVEPLAYTAVHTIKELSMSRKRALSCLLMTGTLIAVSSASALGQSMMTISTNADYDRSVALYNAGIKHMNKEQFAEAAEKFKEAAHLQPAWIEAYQSQAAALMY